ncbi:MAG: tetratricopeptide repeat protein, partial [Candidatus Obscuribacterales bacterium]|nr:tetratricopeptide repeat protein [Candidatus Obscuribacterales bacterium]
AVRAESLYKRAIEIWEDALGPDHANVLCCLESYAELLRMIEREADAATVEKKVELIRRKSQSVSD